MMRLSMPCLLIAMMLCSFAALAQVELVEHTITGNFDGAISVNAADLDGDGDMDVLGTAWRADDIAWWENLGNGQFSMHLIDGSFGGARCVAPVDVDGDGAIDILGAAWGANQIAWWENLGNNQFSEHLIDGDFEGALSVYGADVDGDGDTDVLGAANSGDDITWWENLGNNQFSEHLIDGDYDGARCVYAADLDGDGDLEVLGTAYYDDDISVWENLGNNQFTEHLLNGDFDASSSVYAADMDGDGDLDVLGAAIDDDEIIWWENLGNFQFSEHLIDGTFDAWTVHAADMDGDGDMDVLGAAFSTDDITWWENLGNGQFSEHLIAGMVNGAFGLWAADLDNDGDADVLGTSELDDDIKWWENMSFSLSYPSAAGLELYKDSTATIRWTVVAGISSVNILINRDYPSGWWEALPGLQGIANTGTANWTVSLPASEHCRIKVEDASTAADFDISNNDFAIVNLHPFVADMNPIHFTEVTVTTDFGGVVDIAYGDMDGDGDIDIVGADMFADEVAWWENNGSFAFTYHVLDSDFDGVKAIALGDLDGDDDLDIAGAGLFTDEIRWWENRGNHEFVGHVAASRYEGTHDIDLTDLDGDTGLDIVSTGNNVDPVSWWRNTFGQQFVGHSIDAGGGGVESIKAVDIDDDNDIDLLLTSRANDQVILLRNDNMSFTAEVIAEHFGGAYAVDVANFDEDTDLDLVGVAPFENQIALWTQNGPHFEQHVITSMMNDVRDIATADFNNDEGFDFVVAATSEDEISWWRNHGNYEFRRNIVATGFTQARRVAALDFNNDGLMDILGAGQDGIALWIQGDGFEMNIELENFAASVKEDARWIIVDWSTISENNVDHYEIERGPGAFELTYAVPSRADGGEGADYQLADTNAALTGQYNYRLFAVNVIGERVPLGESAAWMPPQNTISLQNLTNPLTNGDGQPLPDGTEIQLWHDQEGNGIGEEDLLVGRAQLNGAELETPGGFIANYSLPDVIPFNPYFRLMCCVPGENRLWYSDTITISAGQEPIDVGAMMHSGVDDSDFCSLAVPDIQVNLFWNSGFPLDLDLWITDPTGETCYYANSPTSTGGQFIRDNMCGNYVNGREEIIIWPQGAPGGVYTVVADWFSSCGYTYNTMDVEVRASVNGQMRVAHLVMEEDDHIEAMRLQLGSMVVASTAPSAASIPDKPALHQNYPNPFNPSTTIAFELPQAMRVSLIVYDILGRETTRLIDGNMTAGAHALEWNCTSCATGVYLIELKGDGFREIRKALLLR